MKKRTLRFLLGSCLSAAMLLIPGFVSSQTSNGDPPDNDIGGNDSPGGVSTSFNGMVNTACSYDPYTGNARRQITDLVVPGAVGAYGLSWTRFYNSRDADTKSGMGVGWRHSYSWDETWEGGNTIRFPDGREVDFDQDIGRSERLPALGHLLLGDGGQVIFEAVTSNLPDGQHTKYRVKRIIDPYGLATEISYVTVYTDDNGNTIDRLSTIREPAGRYLKLSYSPTDGTSISKVEAFDALGNLLQSVSYTYSFTFSNQTYATLTGANYDDGTAAVYTYQNDNAARRGSPGIPLLKTCDDVRYGGSMHQIDYLFVAGDRIRGKIKSERKFGSLQAVSTLTFPSGRSAQNRVETRGDGPKRTFTYASNGWLRGHSDFTNVYYSQRLTYDGNGFLHDSLDALNRTVTYTREPNIGQVTQILHADRSSHVDFDYGDANNPYYLWTRTDERQNTTYFYRDGNHRVQQINYPDGAYETFAYNNLGRLTTHRRKNGAFDHFVYDSEGRLRKKWNPTATASWPPSDSESHITIDYYPSGHPWAERVSTVSDQRRPNPSITTYEYDRDNASQPCAGLGLITRMTHVDGTYVSFAYDRFGNVIAAENELRKRTNYAYDDYNRVLTVTPPAPAGATTFTYERSGTGDPYLHTSRAVHIQTDGAGVTVENIRDVNFRVTSTVQLDGTTEPPTTKFDYLVNGLLSKVHDPRDENWITSYGYTARNELETVKDALDQITYFHHDPAGNVDWTDRPDGKRVTKSYDAMNRVQTMAEPVTDGNNKITNFGYWPSGNVHTITDDNNQVTTFTYDAADRQQYMFYPDGTFQQWDYDEVNVLRGYRTVGGKIQRFEADNRNRVTRMWWDPGQPEPEHRFAYDAAGRLIGAENGHGTITRRYDDAGRLLTEEQNVFGLGAKTVTYGTDGVGKRTAMGLAGTDYQFAYHYDALGRLDQLLNVQTTAGGPSVSLWYQYSYDAASNETQRYCPMNGIAQIYRHDALGRVDNLTVQKATEPQYAQPGGGIVAIDLPHLPGILAGLTNLTGVVGAAIPTVGTILSSEQYGYDPMSRVQNVYRGGSDAAGNDGYAYDYTGQLTSASYSSWNGGGTRSVNYSQDDLGNRSQITDNGSPQGYSSNNSYRNQYTGAPSGGVSSNGEHQIVGYAGVSYSYRNNGQLASVNGNGNGYGLSYDPFGRCVKRVLNNSTIYYTYDGPHPIYEWKADGTRAGWNLYGKGIDEILLRGDYQVLSNGQGYFFQQNKLGSVTHLTGFAGEVIERYRYDAFGGPTTVYSGGVFNNRFKFTGREYQTAFGVYEYRNRAYDPSLGRFLSEDPMGFAAGDSNLFRYCGGDPVNQSDPFGLVTSESKKYKDGNDGVSWGDRNYNMGTSNFGGFSTQGFWSTPEGFPTNLTSIAGLGATAGSGPDSTGQGGGSGGGSNYSLAWQSPVEITLERITVSASSVLFGAQMAGADFFGFRPGDVSWLPGRMPDYFQFSFSVPAPVKGLAWFGAQGAFSFYPRTGHMFLGLGPGVGFPQNFGAMVTANWVGSWSSPDSPPVSSQGSASIDLSGAIYVGGTKSWSLTGDPNSFGIGGGSKGIGVGAIGTIQLWGQLWGPKG